MQKIIGLIGYVDKTNFIINLAKTFSICDRKVLVIDATIESKMKYTIPTIDKNKKEYITQYDEVDFAFGFKTFKEVEACVASKKSSINKYDYILIDMDSSEGYTNMNIEQYSKIYFFVEHTNISIAKNEEIIEGIKGIICENRTFSDKKLMLTKVTFRYYITRASEEYYASKLNNLQVNWSDNTYDMPYEDTDRIADIETQQSGLIQPNKHTKTFISTIADMAAENIEEFNSGEIRRKIKENARRGF